MVSLCTTVDKTQQIEIPTGLTHMDLQKTGGPVVGKCLSLKCDECVAADSDSWVSLIYCHSAWIYRIPPLLSTTVRAELYFEWYSLGVCDLFFCRVYCGILDRDTMFSMSRRCWGGTCWKMRAKVPSWEPKRALKCLLGSQRSVPKCPLGWQNTLNCPLAG